ncbi:predicted protein [Postia placenta Mad-698-R]|nr:predicted protein [Postia placenta Mad-698-R]
MSRDLRARHRDDRAELRVSVAHRRRCRRASKAKSKCWETESKCRAGSRFWEKIHGCQQEHSEVYQLGDEEVECLCRDLGSSDRGESESWGCSTDLTEAMLVRAQHADASSGAVDSDVSISGM